nr:hypothetical protein [uncultured Flavobacterium sp.]
MKLNLALLLMGLIPVNTIFSQETYPQTKGYFSVVHPIVTIDGNDTAFNFSDNYTVGFPTGINILKSNRFGYSFEIAPFIKAENGKDKVSNVLFHPGLLFRYEHGFTFISRLAFETNGRYGFTMVFNKAIIKNKNVSYFIATPLPVRFGNEKPISVGIGFQLGATF